MVPLINYCTNITDGEHGSVIDDPNGNYYLLSNKNLVNGDIVITKEDRKIDKQTFDRINKRTKIEIDDILLSTVGSIGKVSLVRKSPNFVVQRSVGIIKPNKEILYPPYLFYLLQTQYYQKLFLRQAKGAIQKCIFIDELKHIVVDIPQPTQEQNRIVRILEVLDSKIALNRKINAELEKMAKELYDYWFVQFDFPNAEGKPYKSSGGKMEYSPILKREIPEGWGVKSLLDIANFSNGLACQKFRPVCDDKLPVVKIKEMHEGITSETEFVRGDIPESVKIHDGDILFSWSASLEVMLWTAGNAGLNQHIFKVTPKVGYTKYYVYYHLSDYIKFFQAIAEARKTTMGHITQDHLKQSRIVVPHYCDILLDFEQQVEPIINEIISLQRQLHHMTNLRNQLLPLLMNGQVKIK